MCVRSCSWRCLQRASRSIAQHNIVHIYLTVFSLPQPTCKVWSWRLHANRNGTGAPRCFLKTAIGKVDHDSSCVSGTASGPLPPFPPSPPPRPPPGPPGTCDPVKRPPAPGHAPGGPPLGTKYVRMHRLFCLCHRVEICPPSQS